MQHFPLHYLPAVNQYLGKYNVFTAEELVISDRLEKQWQESQQNYSILQLLEIFPETRPTVARQLKAEIKELKAALVRNEEVRHDFNNKILSRVGFEHKWFWTMIRDLVYLTPEEEIEKEIKKNYFLLSALKPRTGEEAGTDKITEQDIARAKSTPVEAYCHGHLHKQGKTLVGKCMFHSEKTGSFTIYTDTNRWWCYAGCGGGDVIDLIIKSRNVNFIEAVKYILHK